MNLKTLQTYLANFKLYPSTVVQRCWWSSQTRIDAKAFGTSFLSNTTQKSTVKRIEQIEKDKTFSIRKYLGELGERFVW